MARERQIAAVEQEEVYEQLKAKDPALRARATAEVTPSIDIRSACKGWGARWAQVLRGSTWRPGSASLTLSSLCLFSKGVPGVLLGDRWFGLVLHAPGAGYASLRGAVRDVSGNASEVTIIHANRVAPGR